MNSELRVSFNSVKLETFFNFSSLHTLYAFKFEEIKNVCYVLSSLLADRDGGDKSNVSILSVVSILQIKRKSEQTSLKK